MRQLHAQRNTAVDHHLPPEERRRVFLERDAGHPGDANLLLGNRIKRGGAHSRTSHKRPLKAARRHPNRPARERLRVKAGIAGRIARLADIAETGANRREEDPCLKRSGTSSATQIPRTKRLRSIHPLDPLRHEIDQQALVARARRMQYAG